MPKSVKISRRKHIKTTRQSRYAKIFLKDGIKAEEHIPDRPKSCSRCGLSFSRIYHYPDSSAGEIWLCCHCRYCLESRGKKGEPHLVFNRNGGKR